MKLPPIPKLGFTAWAIVAFLLVFAGVAPFFPIYVLTIVISLFVFMALAYSMNFITGLTGYVSFGHVVFMGVGAYGWGYVVSAFHWHPLGGVVVGAMVGLVLALGLGSVTLRFRGVYFAIASLIMPLVAVNIVLVIPAIGGGQGIILNLGFEPLSWFYTIWVILAIEIGVTFWVTHGRIGYGLRAIKSDEDAAKTLGVDAARLKLIVFCFSGLFAGAAGAVNAWTLSGVFPSASFELLVSLQMLAMIIVGGMGTLLGPLLGAIVVYLPSYYFLTIVIGAQFIVIGIVVAFIALVIPEGLVGTLRQYVPGLRRFIE